MESSASNTPAGSAPTRAVLKVVRDLDFGRDEEGLHADVLDALAERSRLARAAAIAVLLGLLAFLFGAHAVIVALGVTTPAWFGRAVLGAVLVLVATLFALIAHAIRAPARPPAPAEPLPADPPLQRRTG